jgi:hypothetical protein
MSIDMVIARLLIGPYHLPAQQEIAVSEATAVNNSTVRCTLNINDPLA